MMDLKLFEQVCNTPGVPGYEDEAQKVAIESLEETCDEVRIDNLNNVIGLKKATNPPKGEERPLRVMLAAHIDEIGAMVTDIDSNGFMRMRQMGGLNPMVLVSQRVRIHGNKVIEGVIPPPKGGDKPPKLDDLLIDTGLPAKDVKKAVNIGDIVTFVTEVEELNKDIYCGRNFDDRIGTYCLLAAMQKVKKTSVDVYAVSSVQEEVGLRGARVAAFSVEPDIGIAIDGSMCWGTNVGKHQNRCGLGEGAGIYMIDNLTIGDKRLVRFLFDMCEKNGITYQRNIGGGTDAKAMQQSRSGALCTTVGAPVRYMHSTMQLCHRKDIEAMVDLLATFMEHAHELLPGDKWGGLRPPPVAKKKAARKKASKRKTP